MLALAEAETFIAKRQESANEFGDAAAPPPEEKAVAENYKRQASINEAKTLERWKLLAGIR